MIPSSPRLQGLKAVNVLRVASAGVGGQTITIGSEVYELTTKDDLSVTAGRIPVNVSGGGTRKAKGIFTFADNALDTETLTIGTKVYTFEDVLTNVDGHVKIGADAEETIDNLVAAVNRTPAGAGTQYALATVKHTLVTAEKEDADKAVITAISGGVAGSSIAMDETGTNIAKDATTLGAAQEGVDPTAVEVLTALEATINAETEQAIEVDKISTTHLLLRAKSVGVLALACTETLTGTNNAWAAAAMYGGARTKTRKWSHAKRVPTAVEVAVSAMHFEIPFTPSTVLVFVAPTATPGAWKIANGAITIDGGHVTVAKGGGVAFAETDTVEVLFIE